MTTKVRDIIKEMEIIAPPFLKESYDNIGLMVGEEEKLVKKVLLALDCTKEVINEAKENQIDLIITHHPLFFKKPNRIVREDLQGWKVIELIKSDISLYSSHTNLDSAKGGINEKIVKMLGFSHSTLIEKSSIKGYEDSGIGRFIELNEELSVEVFIKKIKESLNIENMRGVIANKSIKRIAIINGSGQDFFGKALALGADCIVTGDTSYHFALDYKELGVTILDPGHFSTEWIVFLDVMKKLKSKFNDVKFISSKVSKDPYSFL
ncbi:MULTISPECIES: Nif3-like dinuclear metal center hexameric protein [Clostridium]|uniref:GTP cyclohydrolase 1 type 2 homolog n=1 Tax=Clostridium cibarium TaxID=2762247 RepID=A0ABR8PNL2_9CLOT|nr:MULTISPECIES: Nif3-like dinuclear metal center hexameric protein [Clostridium]MBD7909769.1 Nif3-like dinuclear metal center hexameric protein [Clostridium cibarium]